MNKIDTASCLFFATLAESGSLSAAARRVGIDRSGVSRRLRELEASASAQLVMRDTRNMALTALGEAFYAQCVAVREQLARAQTVLHSHGGLVHGPLRVSAPPALTRAYLAPLFERFCRTYPAVSLDVSLQAGPVDLIDRQIDVAMRFTNEPEPHYVARPLAVTEWLLCASPVFLSQCGPIASPADLATQPWLGIRGRMEVCLQGGGEASRLLFASRVACADYGMLLTLCTNGLGVGMLPAYLACAPLNRGELVRVLPALRIDPTPGSTLYAITLQSRYMPPQVRTLVTYLKSELRLHSPEGLLPADTGAPAD